MIRIAYLASAATLPGSPTRRDDAYEHDREVAALSEPLRAAGMSLEEISWDDPAADWAGFDAAVIRTTWDYWDRRDAFLETLARIERATRLYNPVDLVAWNIDKTYLRDLDARGVETIPTLWLDRADKAAVERAFDTFSTDDLVLKRQVGAGADGQVRLTRGEPVPRLPHKMMAQAFLPAIQTEGEYSFIFIDGALSHALAKRPKAGDYRIQSTYGGVEAPVSPPPEDLAAAARALAALGEPPLYARVDMARGSAGRLLLMELEAIEPYLYPLQGPELGVLMAEALRRRLG